MTRPVLGSRPDALRASGLVLGSRRMAVVSVFGFAAALTAAAQVAIPLPGTPVPLTLQPLVVVLSGMMLGPTLGATSMMLYLAAGVVGLPVFAPIGVPGVARLLGPTGGYLIAFPFAAYASGFVALRKPSLMGRWAAAMLGMVVIFIGGLAQLAILTGGLSRAIAIGVTPFAALDVVKALIAALLARPLIRTPPG